jgi:hypothetical protein
MGIDTVYIGNVTCRKNHVTGAWEAFCVYKCDYYEMEYAGCTKNTAIYKFLEYVRQEAIKREQNKKEEKR